MNQKYPFSAYDQYLSLTISPALWLGILFLLRPYAIMVLSLSNIRGDKMALINMVYGDRSGMAIGALAALPALAVVYATVKRKPDATDRTRWLWHHARQFLIVSGIMNMGVVFVPLLFDPHFVLNHWSWLQLFLSAYITYELFTSQRIRDTFNDFPAPEKK